ncbi:YbaY family lipoprotein [Roseomonas sp. CECT 9278]|uniref:YbaY family lipoprotein n=1 Tax=Roseomonas sp. CECT 9278 TaxID=2845823 RepID=UPI001E636BB8|nr:YbaY family lipoprotein [Roseomonas sp. CECT 9278]
MNTTRRATLALALMAPQAARAQDGTITGTATYRERIALPPGAVLEVELRDTSRADAPAPRLAGTRVEATGQVPIRFTLRFDPARIDPRGSYTLVARLSVDGQLRFRGDTAHPVLTHGAGTTAEILLVGAAPSSLAGAPWVVREIGGWRAPAAPRADITFDGQGRAHGSGGCNRFNAGYVLDGAALRFGPAAQTNMACEPPAMALEARFHAALATVRAWRIEGAELLLLDGAGAAAIRLARHG